MKTRKQTDKQEIVRKIKAAAQLYKSNLIGKTFLYVFDNRHIEVLFKADNFRHLTGVDTDLSAKRFYQLAVQRKLESTQIYFSAIHPYSLCVRKLAYLANLADLTTCESFMLEEISTQSYTYKFGTTDLHFSLCMGEDRDIDGQLKSTCYIPQSLRDEDCFSKSQNVYTITHIFSKSNDVKKYTNLMFMDKSADNCSLPDSVRNLLSDELIGCF